MKRVIISIFAMSALLLSACAGSSETDAESTDLQEPQVSSVSDESVPQVASDSEQQTNPQVDMKDRLVNDQTELIVGIFGLEGTYLAITAEQATSLITLWNSLLELSQSQDAIRQDANTQQEDMDTLQEEADALVEQIKAVLTTEQLEAITNMAIDQETVNVFMQEQNITTGGGMQPGQGDDSIQSGTPFADDKGTKDGGTPSVQGTPGAGGPGENPQGGRFQVMGRLL